VAAEARAETVEIRILKPRKGSCFLSCLEKLAALELDKLQPKRPPLLSASQGR
jgi:hypothetical protein